MPRPPARAASPAPARRGPSSGNTGRCIAPSRARNAAHSGPAPPSSQVRSRITPGSTSASSRRKAASSASGRANGAARSATSRSRSAEDSRSRAANATASPISSAASRSTGSAGAPAATSAGQPLRIGTLRHHRRQHAKLGHQRHRATSGPGPPGCGRVRSTPARRTTAARPGTAMRDRRHRRRVRRAGGIARVEPEEAEDAQVVLGDAPRRVADEANDARRAGRRCRRNSRTLRRRGSSTAR